MGNVLGSERPKHSEHMSTKSKPETPPLTPTVIATSSQNLVSEIRSIYHALIELPDLAPGNKVNALLTRLVSICVEPYSQDFVAHFFHIEGVHTLGEQLRPLCATAEGELENFWAQKIVSESLESRANPAQTRAILGNFPYHQNYLDLSRIECATLSAFLPTPSPPERIAFVGSGPLPLTSICMLDIFPSARVHNIDRDASALSISRQLSVKLGYAGRMSFSCTDVSDEGEAGGEEETEWGEFDVVFLAALVGMDTSSKQVILEGLVRKLRPGALVVARSAKGLRGVLYPILEMSEDLEKVGLEMLVEVHPWTKVVNSVIVLRVKER